DSIGSMLGGNPSEADRARAREELMREAPTNANAAKLLDKVNTDTALTALGRVPTGTADSAKQVETIMKGLVDRAATDPYALSALTAVLAYGTGDKAVKDFNDKAGAENGAKVPDLSKMGKDELAKAKAIAAEQLHKHVTFWGGDLSKSEATALTAALTQANATGDRASASQLEHTITP